MDKLKPRTGVLTRNVTKTECSWLPNDLIKGTAVFQYIGPTWSCITPQGVAVLLDPHEEFPFFEVPINAVVFDN